MEGRVEAVEPGRYLRFRWWPAGAGPDQASEVAYVLEPADARSTGGRRASIADEESDSAPADRSTILTVEEAPVSAWAQDLAGTVDNVIGAADAGGWTRVDDLRLECWAGAHRAVVLVGR